MSNANIDEAQSKLPKIQLIPKAIERSGWTLTTMSQWFRNISIVTILAVPSATLSWF